MRLLFKQRFFSWFDSYNIYFEDNSIAFTVQGQLAWGHLLQIYDAESRHLGTVRERVFSFLPRFELYQGAQYLGDIRREFTFFRPSYTINCNGWTVDGDLLGWNYRIRDARGEHIASINKELLHFTDTYLMDIADPQNALLVLMVVLAIDAANCSQNGD